MAASTSTLIAVFFLLFPAIIVHGSSTSTGTNGGGSTATAAKTTALDTLCGSLGSYHVKPEQCTSALCYDPSSPCGAAHDVPSLAALAARLTAANATAARDAIGAALSSARRAGGETAASNNSTAAEEEITKAGLRSCLELYAGAVPALEWSARSVAAGRYRGAREVMNATWFVTHACSVMVDDATRQVVVPRENEEFGVMVRVASSILAFILNSTRLF